MKITERTESTTEVKGYVLKAGNNRLPWYFDDLESAMRSARVKEDIFKEKVVIYTEKLNFIQISEKEIVYSTENTDCLKTHDNDADTYCADCIMPM